MQSVAYAVRPVEHFIIVFLPAVAVVLLIDQRIPSRGFVGVVFVGSQFPDLIDKPLAHYFGVIPSGRVFMHSLPIALPFLAMVLWYGLWTHRSRLSVVFVVAHLSHLFADNYHSLRASPPSVPTDLLWPITQAAPRPTVPYWAGPNSINLHLWTAFSATVLTVCLYVLIEDLRAQLAA
jgi:hypothetical protein